MSEEQLRILNKIAENLENSPNTKENARKILVDAGILTEKGNIRKPYKDVLKRNKS